MEIILTFLMLMYVNILVGKNNLGSRAYVNVLTLSFFYYSIAGCWYWFSFRDGSFMAVSWNGIEGTLANWMLVNWISSSVLVIYFEQFIFRKLSPTQLYANRIDDSDFGGRPAWILYATGLSCSIYVYLKSGSIDESNIFSGNPLFLMISAFADIQVPAILYGIATAKKKKLWFAAAALYIIYGIYVGFRSKLALLIGPLLLSAMLYDRIKIRYKIFAAFCIAVVLLGFSIMTISRSKFGGVDISSALDADVEALIFGLMAESNIIFGLASSLDTFGNRVPFVGLSPLLDIFVQWIPRFIYKDKILYDHLTDLALGLGSGWDSIYSGTSQPYFAEYYAMGGTTGVAVGVILTSIAIAWLNFIIVMHAKLDFQRYIGISLIAIFFGYFYYSRGAIAPISKIFIFFVCPYIYLIIRAHKNKLASR